MPCLIEQLDDVQIGNQPKLRGTFRDAISGEPTDPSATYVTVTSPTSGAITYEYGVDVALVHEEEGVFYVLVDANAAGTWYVQFWSTGILVASHEVSFTVTPLGSS